MARNAKGEKKVNSLSFFLPVPVDLVFFPAQPSVDSSVEPTLDGAAIPSPSASSGQIVSG